MTDLLAEARAAYSSQPQWDRIVNEDVLRPGREHFGRMPSCGGCRHGTCCDQSVFVWLYEALPIAYTLRESGRDSPELRALLSARDGLQRHETTFQHWERHIGCAFQDDASKLCTVYAARPGICRSYVMWENESGCRQRLDHAWSSSGATQRHHKRIGPSLFLSSVKLQERLGLSREWGLVGTLPGAVLGVLRAFDAPVQRQAEVLRATAWLEEREVDRLASPNPLWRPQDLMECMMGMHRPA